MNTKERIQAFIKHKKLKNKQFEDMCKLGNGFVSKIGDTIRAEKLDFISNTFPELNIEWVKHGTGKMLLTDNTTTINGFTTYLLPMSAMGGTLTGFCSSATLKDCEAVISPIENVDFAITVYGESMFPEYPSGSRVLIKKINPSMFIDWGKVYVLDTPNGVVVKEIHEIDNDPSAILCVSINQDPKFRPFQVKKDDIYGMYRVLLCMSAK